MKNGYENAKRLVVNKFGRKFSFQSAAFMDPIVGVPFETLKETENFLDNMNVIGVMCFLNEAPNKQWETAARKMDGKYYTPYGFALKGVIMIDPETKNKGGSSVWDVMYIGEHYELILERAIPITEAVEYAWAVYEMKKENGSLDWHMD